MSLNSEFAFFLLCGVPLLEAFGPITHERIHNMQQGNGHSTARSYSKDYYYGRQPLRRVSMGGKQAKHTTSGARPAFAMDLQETDTIAARALGDFLVARDCFVRARNLLPQEAYTAAGAQELVQMVHDKIYGQIAQSDITVGTEVNLVLTLSTSVMALRQDEEKSVTVDTSPSLGGSFHSILCLRVCDADGKKGIAALFDRFQGNQVLFADAEQWRRQTCLTRPEHLSLLLWQLAQAEKISIAPAPGPVPVLSVMDPMTSFAKMLRRKFDEMDRLDTNTIAQAAASAIRAARIAAASGCTALPCSSVSQETAHTLESYLDGIIPVAHRYVSQLDTSGFLVDLAVSPTSRLSKFGLPQDTDSGGAPFFLSLPQRLSDGRFPYRATLANAVADTLHRPNDPVSEAVLRRDVSYVLFLALTLLDQSPRLLTEIAESAMHFRETAQTYYRFLSALQSVLAVELLTCGV